MLNAMRKAGRRVLGFASGASNLRDVLRARRALNMLEALEPRVMLSSTLIVDGLGGQAGHFSSIQAAINAAAAGDVINVKNTVGGDAIDYTESPQIVGAAKNGLTLVADPGVRMTLDVTKKGNWGNLSDRIGTFYVNANDITFQGFTFIGNKSATSFDGMKANSWSAIFVQEGHDNIEVRDCSFDHFFEMVITGGGAPGTSNVTVERNFFTNIGDAAVLLQAGGSNNLIQFNTFTNTTVGGSAITTAQSGTNWRIRNNTFPTTYSTGWATETIDSVTPIVMESNNFSSGRVLLVEILSPSATTFTLDARNNFFGASTGPDANDIFSANLTANGQPAPTVLTSPFLTAAPLFQQEVAVSGGNLSLDIDDGDTTPDNSDGTDFGTLATGSLAPERTFTVLNHGSQTLTMSAVTLPAGFSLVEGLPATLAPGASDTFTVALDTAAPGQFAGNVSFDTNDADEGTFIFAITGTVEGAVVPPEINVSGNATNIADNDDTPSTNDGTDFGSVEQNAAGPQRTFVVTNSGGSALTLGVVNLPVGYELIEALDSEIAPGDFDTFTVGLLTTAPGTFSGEISIGNNDSDENPFNFAITGVVTEPPPPPTFPEIAVSGDDIVDGDDTPSADDGTDFGSVEQNSTGPQRTFTVANTGDAALTLGTVNLPAGYDLVEGLDTQIAAGDFDTFTLALLTTTAGTFSGEITFSNNDSDENPFNFAITGTVTEPPPPPTFPEIAVSGDGDDIVDGDNTPSADDGTDFGSVEQNAVGPQRTFTVSNTGDAALTLGAVNLPTGYSLVEGLDTQIAPGDSDTFTVALLTTTPGTFSGEITFSNNDSNENPFNFAITGTVTELPPPPPAVGPEAMVRGNGIEIIDGDTTPDAADNTDFGTVLTGSDGVLHSFVVTNVGSKTLKLKKVRVPKGYTIVDKLVNRLAPGASDTFVIRFNTSKPGVYSGEVSFRNNDRDESPYNFAITGIVANPPASQYQFDFGTEHSQVGAGFVQVTKTSVYTPQTRFGWSAGRVDAHANGGGDFVLRDLNKTRDGTFSVDLPSGSYNVTITTGDLGNTAHDNMQFSLEGVVVDTISTAKKQVVTRTYLAQVLDGQLTLRLRDLDGGHQVATIQALRITPA